MLCLARVSLLLPAFAILPILTAEPDFAAALQKVNTAKPDINYAAFCVEKYEGEDKLACRIKSVPSVGFLVCKNLTLGGEPCKEVIKTELNNIALLSNANVNTVKVSPPQINDVRCGTENSLACSGFLEGWVDEEVGQFLHVRNHIADGKVKDLIEKVKKLTKSGLQNTAADLKKIKQFMEEKKYRQICDLQGFFLVNGGFLVGDVPSIEDNMAIDQPCWKGEPTTAQVLNALDKMIQAFSVSKDSVIV